MNVFDRYAPCVREYIYGQDWRSLRGVQVAAGEAIFGSEEHVLLTSSTASRALPAPSAASTLAR